MTNAALPSASAQETELTVIIVSYNTRELTLKSVETLIANAGDVAMRIVVHDNASADGSAEAIAQAFPQVEVVAHPENIGFARANNLVAERVDTEWMLLLNPDTETHPKAIENLLTFSKAHPEAGITGGRTVFPNGKLNPASCWRQMTLWSLFANAVGLAQLFPNSELFNREAMGGWQRDSVREVDIVVGCFLMIPTALWRKLGGFDPRYFMYGEEADLCLRARKLGYRPMITPEAQIMHLVGASTAVRAEKAVAVLRAKATLVRDHWPAALAPIGVGLLKFAALTRRIGAAFLPESERRERLLGTWRKRHEWAAGY